ncbi:MAG: ABC transporter permease, partial [Nitrososphaerota archaeon]
MQKRLVAKYVAKRIVVYVLTMFIAFSVVFFFLRLIPGDPVLRYIQQVYERYAYRLPQTEEIIQEYRRTLGLDGD